MLIDWLFWIYQILFDGCLATLQSLLLTERTCHSHPEAEATAAPLIFSRYFFLFTLKYPRHPTIAILFIFFFPQQAFKSLFQLQNTSRPLWDGCLVTVTLALSLFLPSAKFTHARSCASSWWGDAGTGASCQGRSHSRTKQRGPLSHLEIWRGGRS